ncbi:3-carboxy-cis,cis-muconate cycloisomerase [Nocardiopsis sp. RSe5-2]|uniref:3-carboxy-cis,cis-muconate cycloisomerase n=1 Tax=Nocardiopsis endophytica TaxID=3018445 RepID=A0ABT4U8G2_9ACTN|nr:3-carboxy-cis,cis-muconate cycloisomerase [Nocardiopsis endophytica]MDA2813253.1 3-carboxy-cis,cis-muconate cycloisomerase [Nocardiopsis endophytica]
MSGPSDTGLLSPVRAGTPVEAAVSDEAWLQAMVDAEAALARAQARLGSVPERAAAVITEAAADHGLDPRALALASREHANPVVSVVAAFTRAVTERSPEAAEYVHRGSTSQDVFDTAAMLVCRRALAAVRDDLAAAADALEPQVRRHRDTPMAGRTLALQAVPTTFGLKAAGWRRLFLDAARRIDRLLDGGLPVSLGGAAGTLGGYLEYAAPPAGGDAPEDPGRSADRLVEAFAAETGLAPQALPWHALRSPVADLASVLAFTAGALGKAAVDVLTLSRTEVGEVAEPGAPGRGASSAMPHKRNPVLATMVRSAALQVPALASVLHQCLAAEDERSAGGWHAEWQPLRECLRLTGGAAHTMVELARGLEPRPERMERNLRLTASALTSERVAAALAPALGRVRARELVSDGAAESVRTGRPLAEAVADRLAREAGGGGPTGAPSAAELAALCDPADYTGAAAALADRSLADRSLDGRGR